MRKILKYILPLGLVVLSIVVVMALAARAKGNRPERKEEKTQAILVDAIAAVQTTSASGYDDVPVTPIIILDAYQGVP